MNGRADIVDDFDDVGVGTAEYHLQEDDLGPFAPGVRLWSKQIALAVPDKRCDVFRNCCREGGDFVRKGAPRGPLSDALVALAIRLGLSDPLGGVEGVEALIADAFNAAEIKHRRTNGAEALSRYEARHEADKPKREPIKLTYFRDCGAYVRKRWLLKGVIAKGETSAWVAPPGAGKSALMTEISVHCAGPRDWRGHKAKERCGVLILALERADLYRRRLHAYRLRDGLPADLPISISGNIVGLLDPGCVDQIVEAVHEAEADFGCKVGLIVIDTFAKGIAVDGGDEDKARDQNRAAANLRNVHARLDAHIALVGHTGKDESRGARGSNAHLGDVDVMIMISGDTIRTAEVTKGNDQPERVLAQFKIESFELGRDDDGDPITTSIASNEVFEVNAERARKQITIPPIPKAALRALYELIADGETTPRPQDAHVPVAVTCVTLAKWRERLIKTATISSNSGNRKQFQRISVTLKNIGKIGIWDDVVWPVT
jgi:AAA domain